MGSTTEIIRAEAGVVLTKVTLAGAAGPAAIGYTVSSKRTPEVPSFDDPVAAHRAFVAEVDRCKAGDSN